MLVIVPVWVWVHSAGVFGCFRGVEEKEYVPIIDIM